MTKAVTDGGVDERLLACTGKLLPVVGIRILGAATLAQEGWLQSLTHVLVDSFLGIFLHA